MRNQRQAPTRNLYLRRMAKEGDRRPCVDLSLPNQFARRLQHNRRNVPPRKGILLIEKGVPIVALVLIESGHKCAESSIRRKYVWSNPNIRAKTRTSRDRTGFTLNQILSVV